MAEIWGIIPKKYFSPSKTNTYIPVNMTNLNKISLLLSMPNQKINIKTHIE